MRKNYSVLPDSLEKHHKMERRRKQKKMSISVNSRYTIINFGNDISDFLNGV